MSGMDLSRVPGINWNLLTIHEVIGLMVRLTGKPYWQYLHH